MPARPRGILIDDLRITIYGEIFQYKPIFKFSSLIISHRFNVEWWIFNVELPCCKAGLEAGKTLKCQAVVDTTC